MKTKVNMKSLLAVLLALIIAVSVMMPTFADTNPFRDVQTGAWYYDAVMYCKDSGLFSGTSSNTFAPDDVMTRAMFVTVIGRYEGIDKTQYTAPTAFADVAVDSWYGPYVKWANENKIVDGYSATRFGPEDALTREQMVTLFYRYATFKGYNTEVEGEPGKNFSDYSATSNFARNAINWAVSRKMIAGTNNGLDPKAITNRAQIAQVFYNISRVEIITIGSKQLVYENSTPEPSTEPEPASEQELEPSPSPSQDAGWKVGDIITMGMYEQDLDSALQPTGPDPIEWVVLEIQDGKALLITRHLLMHMPKKYDRTTIACWETSETRARLNNEFYNMAFTDEEKGHILNTTVKASPFESVWNWTPDGGVYPDPDITGIYDSEGDLARFNAKYARDTSDKLFLLSKDEVIRYLVNNPVTNKYMAADRTGYNELGVDWGGDLSNMPHWVLRTTCAYPNALYYVGWGKLMDRPILLLSDIDYASIRPAMWVKVDNTMELDKTTLDLHKDESVQLNTINPASHNIQWTTSDASVATVTSDGVVTANAGGSCIVTAYDGYSKATCAISVAIPEVPVPRELSINILGDNQGNSVSTNSKIKLVVTCTDPTYDLSGALWSVKLPDKYERGPVDPETGASTWIPIPNDHKPESTIDNNGVLHTGNSPEVVNVIVTVDDTEAIFTFYVGM